MKGDNGSNIELIHGSQKIQFREISIEIYERNIEDVFFRNKKFGKLLEEMKNIGNKDYLEYLHKHGDKPFCRFKISENLYDRGLYCFIVNDDIKYIGRCLDNFKSRINNNYGKISSRGCLKNGQSTNCHINSRINNNNLQLGVHIINDRGDEYIKLLEKNILIANSFKWNTQKK